MMNVENILKVADAIEKHSIAELGFNMSYWASPVSGQIDQNNNPLLDHTGHNCGTVACLAGWAHAVRTGRAPRNGFGVDVDGAAEWLGLDDYANLFQPGESRDWPYITDKQAVAVLRHLAATGEVNWAIASQSLPSEGEV